jgi:hypothetical protein
MKEEVDEVDLEAIAAAAAQPFTPRPRWRVLDAVAGVVGGVIVARMFASWFWRPDLEGIARFLAYFIIGAGLVAGGVRVYTYLRQYVASRGARATFYVALLAVFVASVVLPELGRGGTLNLGDRRPGIRAELAKLESTRAQRWREVVRETRAHAPNGVEPPMLLVSDEGRRVELQNINYSVYQVRLTRSDGTSPDAACRMHQAGSDQESIFIGAQQTISFVLSKSAPRSCETLPLEYEVNGPRLREAAWWSDGALRALDARLAAGGPLE